MPVNSENKPSIHSVSFKRLERFLKNYRRVRPPIQFVGPQTVLPDRVRLLSFLTNVKEPLETRRALGLTLNPWTMAGVQCNEVRNSAILATLWSPQACGQLGIEFLDAFCRTINDPTNVLPTTLELQSGYTIRTEHCPIGEISERVDITIEGETFVLGIEVKINAPKGSEQLKRYIKSVANWSKQGGRRSAVVFLAPYAATEPGVLCAEWNNVAAAAKSILRNTIKIQTNHQFLLDCFVQHIAQFRA